VIRFRADWVLPIADTPIRSGWVGVDGGRIAAVGSEPIADVIDLGRVVILPGLVNAHTHLELSYLHRQVPRPERFLDWIRAVMAARRKFPDASDPAILGSARASIADASAAGTAVVGDVSNTLVTVPLLNEARLPAHVFFELLRFNASDGEPIVRDARAKLAALPEHPLVRLSVAPHAPYSVSPALFSAIRADLDADPDRRSTVHLGESPEEIEFLKQGSGGWRMLLEELGAWTDGWRAPGASPVAYLDRLGFLSDRVLAVHGVQLSGDDLDILRKLGVTLVSCPRSNRYVGVGPPPLEAFYASGVTVAFGTDSLASAEDLNMFAELAEARRIAPRVPARALLESATLAGARGLGFEGDFGTIEPGKRAALLAVRLPAGIDDVEEYLVSGIEPTMIRWLDETNPKSQ
jgi:cytosine/adenosine deaminase-related metal-dependent hydrolase